MDDAELPTFFPKPHFFFSLSLTLDPPKDKSISRAGALRCPTGAQFIFQPSAFGLLTRGYVVVRPRECFELAKAVVVGVTARPRARRLLLFVRG